MNKLYDALENCLQEIENGSSLENALARYPEFAGELRPLLKASMKARTMVSSEPSPEAFRRGRAKLLQRASAMTEAKRAPARRRVIPIFQRLALSVGVAATFLLSGTGLVSASTSALPGENLYPVKRTWEDVRLFFTFDQNTRAVVESQYEIERLHEVSELIAEGRHERIQFVGVFTHINGQTYVSGVPVVLPANMQAPEDGVAVLVTGRTNAQGFVELDSLELLPDGAFVPLGLPMEVETKHETHPSQGSGTDSNSNSTPSDVTPSDTGSNSNDSGSEPIVVTSTEQQSFEAEGFVESFSDTTLVLNGRTIYLVNTRIEGTLQIGAKVEVKGYYASDGRFIVTELKVKFYAEDNNNENSSSGSGSDSNNNDGAGSNDNGSSSNDNSNSNSNDSGNGNGNSNDSGNSNGNGNGNSNENGNG